MRFIFLVIFVTVSFSASAQWYRTVLEKMNINLPRKQGRNPLINQPSSTSISIAQLPVIPVSVPPIQRAHFNRSRYSYNAEEMSTIHSAQHNMGRESYTEASHNFSSLGRLYIRQRRFSEAKWYLLQSNDISRRQNDDKLTVSNLIDLAVAKTHIGDFKLAEKDLNEAQQIATTRGYTDDLVEIEKRLLYIKQNSYPSTKNDVRYAEAP